MLCCPLRNNLHVLTPKNKHHCAATLSIACSGEASPFNWMDLIQRVVVPTKCDIGHLVCHTWMQSFAPAACIHPHTLPLQPKGEWLGGWGGKNIAHPCVFTALTTRVNKVLKYLSDPVWKSWTQLQQALSGVKKTTRTLPSLMTCSQQFAKCTGSVVNRVNLVGAK